MGAAGCVYRWASHIATFRRCSTGTAFGLLERNTDVNGRVPVAFRLRDSQADGLRADGLCVVHMCTTLPGFRNRLQEEQYLIVSKTFAVTAQPLGPLWPGSAHLRGNTGGEARSLLAVQWEYAAAGLKGVRCKTGTAAVVD
jgi:hypothetical protein